MKIAISGKGGVGKTTISAMLAGALAAEGRPVIAVDADPDANLGGALGVPASEPLTPIGEMRELIAERTGSDKGYGGYFKINPRVDDLPERFAGGLGAIRLLVLGGIGQGGSGCICPATALLKALLMHLVLREDESLIMDMEAGIEHLGRATAQSVDALLIVVDEGPWSVQCAHRVRKLAGDIGLTHLLAVANQITDAADLNRLREELDPIPLVGKVSYDTRLRGSLFDLDDQGEPVAGAALGDHLAEAREILSQLQSRIKQVSLNKH